MSNTNKQPSYLNEEISKDNENKLKSIIDSIEKDPLSYEFRQPVDVVGLGLTDYYDYILKPMDLSTVKKNLKNGKYIFVYEVLSDIQQIWTNCKIYNQKGSEFYHLAEVNEKNSKKLIEKYFKHKECKGGNQILLNGNKNMNSGNSGSICNESNEYNANANKKHIKEKEVKPNKQVSNQLTYEDKIKFTEGIRIADPEILNLIVNNLLTLCPKSIQYDDENEDNISIVVDDISKSVYDQIIVYLI